jgi:NADH:ubiquinone oxidoreductase subunit 2 (subunit N)
MCRMWHLFDRPSVYVMYVTKIMVIFILYQGSSISSYVLCEVQRGIPSVLERKKKYFTAGLYV